MCMPTVASVDEVGPDNALLREAEYTHSTSTQRLVVDGARVNDQMCVFKEQHPAERTS